MTNMDRKINELNAKLGRKTGIDFKETAKVIAKETYQNKPLYYGILTGTGVSTVAFVLSGAGLIASAVIGASCGYVYRLYSEDKLNKNKEK